MDTTPKRDPLDPIDPIDPLDRLDRVDTPGSSIDDLTDEVKRPGSGDVSPPQTKRAQPGDILGIETGGETTAIGDTAEDEDERHRDAEKK